MKWFVESVAIYSVNTNTDQLYLYEGNLLWRTESLQLLLTGGGLQEILFNCFCLHLLLSDSPYLPIPITE
jgi:hypothetical protein